MTRQIDFFVQGVHWQNLANKCVFLSEVKHMTANEWLKKNNIDLSKYHGNVGDYEGNICIETDDGWIFWNAEGKWEKVTV